MLTPSNSTLRYAKIAPEKIGSTAMAGKTISIDLPLLSNHTFGHLLYVRAKTVGLAVRGAVAVPELFVNAEGAAMTRAGFEYIHANVYTARLYDRRKTRPEDSPTFRVRY